MSNPEQIRATVETYLRAVASGDPDQVVALYAADGTLEDPVGSEVRVGHEAIGEFYGSLKGITTTTELRELRIAGNEATFLFTVTSEFGDKAYIVSPIDHMTFDAEGRILSMRAFWSPADMKVG